MTEYIKGESNEKKRCLLSHGKLSTEEKSTQVHQSYMKQLKMNKWYYVIKSIIINQIETHTQCKHEYQSIFFLEVYSHGTTTTT